MNEAIFNQVQGFLADQLRIDASTIAPASNLRDDLRADSLDVVQLVMAVEEAFNIEVEDEAVGKIVTVADVVTYIEGKL